MQAASSKFARGITPGSENDVLRRELIVNKYNNEPITGIAGDILIAKNGQLNKTKKNNQFDS